MVLHECANASRKLTQPNDAWSELRIRRPPTVTVLGQVTRVEAVRPSAEQPGRGDALNVDPGG